MYYSIALASWNRGGPNAASSKYNLVCQTQFVCFLVACILFIFVKACLPQLVMPACHFQCSKLPREHVIIATLSSFCEYLFLLVCCGSKLESRLGQQV